MEKGRRAHAAPLGQSKESLMQRTWAVWQRVRWAAGTAAAWLLAVGIALAQPGRAVAPPNAGAPVNEGGQTYAISYGVVILGVFLGLLFVLNPSRRRDRPKGEV
jgi:hypothetical protein